jgi:hypothetical protein
MLISDNEYIINERLQNEEVFSHNETKCEAKNFVLMERRQRRAQRLEFTGEACN